MQARPFRGGLSLYPEEKKEQECSDCRQNDARYPLSGGHRCSPQTQDPQGNQSPGDHYGRAFLVPENAPYWQEMDYGRVENTLFS